MTPSRRRLLALAWTLAILAACSLPGRSLPDPAPGLPLDKAVHFALFFGFGLLWRRAGAGTGVLLAAGGAYALLLEPYQSLVAVGRLADPYDAAMNLAGLVTGLAAAAAARRYRQRKQGVDDAPDHGSPERDRYPVRKTG